MEKFTVTDPKGISHGGTHFAKGDEVLIGDDAVRAAFLHFGQIAAVKEAKEDHKETPKHGGK